MDDTITPPISKALMIGGLSESLVLSSMSISLLFQLQLISLSGRDLACNGSRMGSAVDFAMLSVRKAPTAHLHSWSHSREADWKLLNQLRHDRSIDDMY